MDQTMREQLAKKGWQVGTVSEFLHLSPDEAALIEIQASAKSCFEGAQLALQAPDRAG